jgi:hypothetical protein
MGFRTHFFAAPPAPGVLPQPLDAPRGGFASIEQARDAAFSVANTVWPQTHSIEIDDDVGTICERWVRDGSTWRKVDA